MHPNPPALVERASISDASAITALIVNDGLLAASGMNGLATRTVETLTRTRLSSGVTITLVARVGDAVVGSTYLRADGHIGIPVGTHRAELLSAIVAQADAQGIASRLSLARGSVLLTIASDLGFTVVGSNPDPTFDRMEPLLLVERRPPC